MNFLTGLGYAAGGLTRGIPEGMQIAQQQQQNSYADILGDALAGYSGQQQPPQQSSPLGSLFGGMFGGQQQPAQAPQQTAMASQPQQAPLAAPSNVVAPPALPPAQPRVAQASTPLGGAAPPSAAAPPSVAAPPQQAPQAPQMQPAQPTRQPAPSGAPQPQMGGGQGLGQGFFTLNDLVAGIKRAKPGIRGREMTGALMAAVPLLNMQGLQQYRQLQGLRLDLGYKKLEEQSQEFAGRQKRLEKEFGLRESRLTTNEDRVAAAREAARTDRLNAERYREKFINLRTKFNKDATAVLYSDDSPEVKQKKLQSLNDKFDEDTQSLQDSLQPTEQKPVERETAKPSKQGKDAALKITDPAKIDKLPKGTLFELDGVLYTK